MRRDRGSGRERGAGGFFPRSPCGGYLIRPATEWHRGARHRRKNNAEWLSDPMKQWPKREGRQPSGLTGGLC
eukprot:3157458-Heterocapsa_arctica.AAC.1